MNSSLLKGKKILVPGGTGAMGIYLVPELVSMGAEVYVTSRRDLSDSPGVRYLCGNAHDMEFLEKCLDSVKPDAIVDFMNYKTPEFKDRVGCLLSSTSHFLFLSSYRVFADANPLTEQSPRLLDASGDKEFLATDIYPLAKARQEDVLASSSYNNWTIIRPCITYSSERFQFGCLEANTVCYRSFQNVPVVIPSRMLERRTTMTWGGDVAKMIARLVLNPAARTESFNTVTAENHTWREVGQLYQDLIGLKYNECTIDEYVQVIGEHYYYQTVYDRMYDRVLDNSKVLKATGLRQSDFRGLRDGLAFELSKFRENQYYPFLNVPENARMDKYCKVSIDLSELSAEDRVQYKEVFDGEK